VSHDHATALMAAYLCGDARAFDALFTQLAPSVRRVLERFHCPADLADELTQVTFLKMHRARATYLPGAPVLPWVLTIARNAFRDACRAGRGRRRHEVLTTDGTLPERPVTTDGGDAFDALSDDEQRVIQEAIEALPANQREALLMLKVEGMTLKEVAAATGASVGAVKLRAHRAYEALREALRVFDARRELNDAALRVRKGAA
jgi:RNA polymerase sigma-70 factor (ECF subfamily)